MSDHTSAGVAPAPSTGLNVQTGIGQQVVTGGEHAITTQNRNMSLIDLHQAIVPAGYLPGFVPVITDGTGVQAAFFNGDGLQQKGINLISLSGLPETPCPGRGSQSSPVTSSRTRHITKGPNRQVKP